VLLLRANQRFANDWPQPIVNAFGWRDEKHQILSMFPIK